MSIPFDGWKSGFFFVVALLAGVANMIGFADFEFSKDALEWLAVLIPLIGLLLRTITSTRAGWLRKRPG